MNKPYIYIAYGVSDSGKDTVASLLNKFSPCQNIKFTECWKRAFEEWLCIPKYSLDDKAFRIKKVINTVTGKEEDYTYNDVMYRWYHQLKEVIPGEWLYAGYLANKLQHLVTSICITDLRKSIEIDVLNKLSESYELVLLNVKGRGKAVSTDNNLDLSKLNCTNVFSIDNSKSITLDQLSSQIQYVVDKLNN